MSLVGDIGAVKTVSLTSCFTAQVTLGVYLGALFLPVVPHLVGRVEVIPLIGGVELVIRGKHFLGDNSNEHVIGYWEVIMIGLELSLLEDFNVLRDAGRFLLVCHHLII